MNNHQVTRKYISAGISFGDDASYLMTGESLAFGRKLQQWENWEKEYAKRGYETISFDKFLEAAREGLNLTNYTQVLRKLHTEPIFHAQLYRQHHLGKAHNNIETHLEDDILVGRFKFPSTENL
jgi:hypothetical protein